MNRGNYKLERIDNNNSNFTYTCDIPLKEGYQLLVVYSGILEILSKKDFYGIDNIIQNSFNSINDFNLVSCVNCLRKVFEGIDEKALYITIINTKNNILYYRLRFDDKKLVIYDRREENGKFIHYSSNNYFDCEREKVVAKDFYELCDLLALQQKNTSHIKKRSCK